MTSGEKVREVSFSVRPGEILGVVALEGQGQDRLFGLLSGDRRPTSGEILVGGERKRFLSPYDAVKEGVVLVPGDRLLALLPSLPVRQNLAVTPTTPSSTPLSSTRTSSRWRAGSRSAVAPRG